MRACHLSDHVMPPTDQSDNHITDPRTTCSPLSLQEPVETSQKPNHDVHPPDWLKVLKTNARPVISFATWWWGAVKVLHCSIDHPSRDIRLWDARPCRDATWGRVANADHPSVHIPPRSFEPASLMLLLLHTEDDTSPQRLPHCLSLHVNHASSERADAPSSGLFNSTPVHISLFFKHARAPDRNPHLV